MIVDAHRWFRRKLRFEYYEVATLRELRVGERLWVGYFNGPGVVPGVSGQCAAYFERVRGGLYVFHAGWTITWNRKYRRPHCLTSGKFKLLPGSRIEFLNNSERAAISFARVCRYCHFFNRYSDALGVPRRFDQG